MSPIKKLASGCKSPFLKHVVSHRRMLYMILNDRTHELKVTFKLTVDGFEYTLFATTENMKCFGCGEEGHLVKSCPAAASTSAEGTSSAVNRGRGARAWGNTAAAGETGNVNNDKGDTEVGNNEGNEQQQVGNVGEEVEVVGEGGGEPDSQPASADSDIDNEEESMQGSQAEEGGSGVGGGAAAEPQLATEIDMGAEEEKLKVDRPKRKAAKSPSGSQPKKATDDKRDNLKVVSAEQGNASTSSVPDEVEMGGWESEMSDAETVNYGLEEMKKFLQKTKNSRGVKVASFFPKKKSFIESAKLNMKKRGKGAFTDQEVFRVKKFLAKVNQETQDNDG